jgi:hypothetical protein
MVKANRNQENSASGRILFRHHPLEDSTEGEAYIYLLRNQIWSPEQGKFLANQAITSFWLPYARQQKNPELARKTAIHAIRQLEMQIVKLRQDFDIPDPGVQKMQIQQIPVLASSQIVHSTPQSQPVDPVVTPKAVEVDDALYGTFDVFEED